jgi:hypothetical protein
MKSLSDTFPIRNGAKQDALSPLVFKEALKYVCAREVQQTLRMDETHLLHSTLIKLTL